MAQSERVGLGVVDGASLNAAVLELSETSFERCRDELFAKAGRECVVHGSGHGALDPVSNAL